MSRVGDFQVEQAWNEISGAGSTPDAIAELMERFGEEQPFVFDFVSEASANLSDDARDLLYHASLVIWRAFALAQGESEAALPVVGAESLVQGFEKSSEWLEKQQGEAILIQKKLSDFSRFQEPELMRYAVELVFEAHEDGLEIEPDEQEDLLLVLKTLIECLAA